MKVIEALEMEDAMDEVACEFAGPVDAKAAGLEEGLMRTEKDLAVEFERG
jgi:hypothetical protein